MRSLLSLVALGLLLPGCTANKPAFTWPTPAGWRSETIPFPLDFAPSLPYRGTEELRFAPGFFEPAAATYFTYSFVWLVDGEPGFDALSGELGTYFAGLAQAVAPKRFDAAAHRATVERTADTYRGSVDTVDAFGDGHALHLGVAGEVVRCADTTGRRSALVLSLSPRRDDATWSMLAAQRRTLHC